MDRAWPCVTDTATNARTQPRTFSDAWAAGRHMTSEAAVAFGVAG